MSLRSLGHSVVTPLAGCGVLALAILPAAAASPAVAAAANATNSSPSPSAGASSVSPAPSGQVPGRSSATTGQIPLLAYYYIWYTPTSWNRLKIDYPLVGRYSSDDVAVMREQVRLAKQVGITGFIVSWKDTPVLDRRLAALAAVAATAGFKLGIVIEGRNFAGEPLPVSQIERSFSYFVSHYSSDPVFRIFSKPVVIWSGTWEFSTKQLASVTKAYGSRLMILASEKEPASYQIVSHLFSGDAYYWSSPDPLHTPGYASKLDEFSTVVHQAGGLWIAPAAPGFDARMIGGIKDVSRRNGQTLRLEMNAAMASGPDAIGLISWNEYSENSEIEPSQAYGATAIQVIASFEHAKAPFVQDFNSSGPAGFHPGPSQFIILGSFILLLGGSVALVMKRR